MSSAARPRRGTSDCGLARVRPLGAGTAARRGCGRSTRGPPVWCRAISLRNRSTGLICGVSAREVPAPPSARGVQLWLGTSAAARRGCGRDKRGPPVWRRAISLRNRSDAIYSTPLHGHPSTSRFDTDRWCTPTDGVFATKIIKNTRDLRILCHFSVRNV